MAAHRKHKPIEIGDVFGLLAVTSLPRVQKVNGYRRVTCECRCQCGHSREYAVQNLYVGNSKSCGCLNREQMSRRSRTHGESKTLLHHVWSSMKARCYRKTDKGYKNYGERGVRVCPQWHAFEPFRDWALANGYAEGLTIERNDYDGDYCPENCVWLPRKDQNKNRRMNVPITAFGETKIISEWAKDPRCKVKYQTLYMRIARGMDPEKALATPVKTWKKRALAKQSAAG
jgi:hypothetical protein